MMKDQPAEGGLSVFQPDLLLPLQFFTALRGRSQGDGQRRLMIAVLEDAIECFQKCAEAKDNRTRQLGSEAEEWFLADDRDWLFSFVNVCETLEIDPAFLRRGLLAWKEKQEAPQPSDEQTASTPPNSGRKRSTLRAA
jgi:hypothetical protein